MYNKSYENMFYYGACKRTIRLYLYPGKTLSCSFQITRLSRQETHDHARVSSYICSGLVHDPIMWYLQCTECTVLNLNKILIFVVFFRKMVRPTFLFSVYFTLYSNLDSYFEHHFAVITITHNGLNLCTYIRKYNEYTVLKELK